MINPAEMTTQQLRNLYTNLTATIAQTPDAEREQAIAASIQLIVALGTELNKREADAMIANRTLNPRA